MNSLTATELSRMRDSAETSMFDRCVIGRWLPDEVDEFNRPKKNWQDEDEFTECGFKIVRNKEAMDDAEIVMVDAELRLPFDTIIDRRDRIRLTHRLGEFLLAERQPTYRIVGEPMHGHGAIKVSLVLETEV